jgi:hypothetical protein
MKRLILLAALVAGPWAVAEEFVAQGYDASQLTPEMIAATDTIAKVLEGVAPAGWKPQGGVERYTTANMYGKINGRSELFMSYGVKGMTWLGLTPEDDPDTTIEVYIYDQGTTLDAFGVYSVERWKEAVKAEVGTEAYRSDADLFFRQGHYYVTLLGGDDTPAVRAAQEEIAKLLAQRLPDDPQALWGDAALPRQGRVAGSLKYFKKDAMSLDFLTNTFVCEVERDGAALTHFVSRQDNAAAAKAAFDGYVKYLGSYGGNGEVVEADSGAMLVGDAGGGYFDAVFHHGADVAGVTAAPSREAAIAAATALREHLRK